MAGLAFFTVTGTLSAVAVDYVDAGIDPDIGPVSATVDFIPRLPLGTVIWSPELSPPQGVMLAPVQARIDSDGVLRTIVGGTGVELTANVPELGLDQLIYDVVFTNVAINKADGYIAPFGFEAPTTATTFDLATIVKLPPKAGL